MKFCKHCGKELQSGIDFCKNCGKPVAKADSKEKQQPKEKQQSLVAKFQSLPKAQKLTISIVSGIILLFIIVAFVVNYMTSSDRLVKKFHAAIIEDNYDALGDLVVFDDTGEKIGSLHAEALADRIDEQDRLQELIAHFDNQNKELTSTKGSIVNLQKEGCLLFFDCYQITAKSYYVEASSNLDGAEVFLDGEKIAVIDHTMDEQKIGPFVYGSYDLEATFENDIVKFHEEEPLVIYGDEESWRARFSYESIWIENNQMPIERTFLLSGEEIGENMILAGDEGEEVGPIDPEQNYTLEIKAAFPWGEMTTGVREADSYFEETYEINDTIMDGLKQAITTFYSDLFEAYNTNSVEPINYLDEGLIDDYSYDIERRYRDAEKFEDYIHFRDVKQFGIATEPVEIYYNKDEQSYKLSVPVLEESFVDSQFYNTEISDYRYRNNYNTFHLSYKDDKWMVEDANFGNWPTDYEYTMFDYEGEPAKVLNSQPKKETKEDEAEDTESTDADEAIEKLTLNYIDRLVEAINAGDYSKVASTIQSGSALEGMQQDLVKRLHDNGTTQEVVAKEVTDVDKDGDAWKVKTSETIKINYSNGDEETEDYNWTYTVVEEDGNYKLSNIE